MMLLLLLMKMCGILCKQDWGKTLGKKWVLQEARKCVCGGGMIIRVLTTKVHTPPRGKTQAVSPDQKTGQMESPHSCPSCLALLLHGCGLRSTSKPITEHPWRITLKTPDPCSASHPSTCLRWAVPAAHPTATPSLLPPSSWLILH